jgi:hypothetical protein
MPDVNENFARDWVEFFDPQNPEHIYKCDLTWLTSNWNCIYGSGCKGIEKDKPNDGCCSDGAYYSSEEDEKRVISAEKRLTPKMWQFHGEAHDKKGNIKISELGLDRDRKTRMVEGSCIFLNRKGESENFGCVLHHLAVKEGNHFSITKPDICWQLPIRRSHEVRDVGDGEIAITVIGEYERKSWGEGGHELDWYCSNNSEAHNAAVPVYISNKNELILMMNEPAYKELVRHCENRLEAIKKAGRRALPLFTIHPATLAAKKK